MLYVIKLVNREMWIYWHALRYGKPLHVLMRYISKTLNQGVQGSNPWWRIERYRFYSIDCGVGAFFVLTTHIIKI